MPFSQLPEEEYQSIIKNIIFCQLPRSPRSIANVVYVIHSNMTLKEYFNAEYLCVGIGYEHVESFVVCIVGNLNGTRCRDGMKCCGVIPI